MSGDRLLRFACPECFRELTAPETWAERAIFCRCGAQVFVPTRASLEGASTVPREVRWRRRRAAYGIFWLVWALIAWTLLYWWWVR